MCSLRIDFLQYVTHNSLREGTGRFLEEIGGILLSIDGFQHEMICKLYSNGINNAYLIDKVDFRCR